MDRILDWLIVAGPAILSVKLLTSGLYRRYRALFCYLVFAALRSGFLTAPSPASKTYFYVWVWTEPVEWLFYVLAVLEIYSLVLQDYRGLATAFKWSLLGAVVVALAASGLSVLVPSHYTSQGPVMTYYYVAERAIYFSLGVFLLTILGLLMRYPISLNRNIIVHSIVFSFYFLTATVMYLLLSMRGTVVLSGARIALEIATVAAMGTWVVMLNPAGEFRQQKLRPTWMPGREEALTVQLNNLNAALLRATRK